jgi:hypothetical protein
MLDRSESAWSESIGKARASLAMFSAAPVAVAEPDTAGS